MGQCLSDEADDEARKAAKQGEAASRQIDRELDKDFDKQGRILKLLLLGAGESGKSTLFKALVTIYGDGYSEEERKQYISIVSNNSITAMKTLLQQTKKQAFDGLETEEAQAAMESFDECSKGEDVVSEELAKLMTTLWNDPGLQKTYEKRAKFQLVDSAGYFFERVHELAKPDYLPTNRDILRCRVRTTGIVETSFKIDGNQFAMFDVGGQRNERKKWIHCFENVTAVIFVVAISAFDQLLFEDEETNRMREALVLFDDVCNMKWFKDTAMILFLNKRDLFEDKIKKIQLSEFFPEYKGDNSYEDAKEWIAQAFEMKNRNNSKEIYTNITCATDPDNIEKVFDAVKDIIIRKSLVDAGLV